MEESNPKFVICNQNVEPFAAYLLEVFILRLLLKKLSKSTTLFQLPALFLPEVMGSNY